MRMALYLPWKRWPVLRGLDQDMIVIGHEAVGMADPIVPLFDVLDGVQEVLTVGVVFEDGLLFIASGGDVVDGAGIFYAEGAGHGERIAEKKANCKCKEKDLTLKIRSGLDSERYGCRCRTIYLHRRGDDIGTIGKGPGHVRRDAAADACIGPRNGAGNKEKKKRHEESQEPVSAHRGISLAENNVQRANRTHSRTISSCRIKSDGIYPM